VGCFASPSVIGPASGAARIPAICTGSPGRRGGPKCADRGWAASSAHRQAVRHPVSPSRIRVLMGSPPREQRAVTCRWLQPP